MQGKQCKQYIEEHKQYTEQHKSLIRKSATMPCLCEVYPGICLTAKEKAQKTLSHGSQRMPVGTMKTEYTEQSIQTIIIHKHNNKIGFNICCKYSTVDINSCN
jgi:hypothetical protein